MINSFLVALDDLVKTLINLGLIYIAVIGLFVIGDAVDGVPFVPIESWELTAFNIGFNIVMILGAIWIGLSFIDWLQKRSFRTRLAMVTLVLAIFAPIMAIKDRDLYYLKCWFDKEFYAENRGIG